MNMFDKSRHHAILVKILKDIYDDPQLRNILVFKGGTAAVLFYNLPRISVDLDFDLLKPETKKLIFERIKVILSQYGKIDQVFEKRNTLFFLLSYEKRGKKIKIEISKRPVENSFESKTYLGIPILLMKKEDMAAGKLSALLTRKKFASRDLFDLWFFLKKDWDINKKVLKARTGLSLVQAIRETIKKVSNLKSTQLLQGLGEFLDQSQKLWVKEKLKDELLFHLKIRLKS